MKWLLILALLVSGNSLAQPRGTKKASTAPATAARWPIEALAVEGNRIYTREQVLAVAGLKIGQIAGKPEFEAARDRLVATGAFETVGYQFVRDSSGKGYAATFQVTEVEQVFPVRFEDLHVSELDLTAFLRARDPLFSPEKLAATQPVLQRYTRWIQEFMTSKGEPGEKIAGNLTPVSAGEWAIVFRPARNLPSVAQVTFEGNEVLPQNTLRDAIAAPAVGAPYTEDRFREILNSSIRPLYETRGRVRVSFPKIRTEPASDVQGLHVFVTVDEGESYELGRVEISGSTPLDTRVLLKAGDFKTGDVANLDRVNEGIERIRNTLRRAGYLKAGVVMRRQIDDAKRAVNVTLHVDGGPLFTMGKLTINGLDLEGEAEMKRIWALKEGKPFNPEYPDLFLKRVREEGMFDNLGKTKAEFKLDEKQHTADVTLTFAGDQPGGRRPGRRGVGGRGGVEIITAQDGDRIPR